MTSERIDSIAVAATFTAQPVEPVVRFWMHELGEEARLELAPYGQVFQQLLAPAGSLFDPSPGLNVVLVRLSDGSGNTVSTGTTPERLAGELVEALSAAVLRTTRPWLVVVCPAPPDVEAAQGERLQDAASRLQADLAALTGVRVVTPAQLAELYPVADYHDARMAELGDAPYTPVFFAALGTLIARSWQATRREPRKVVALDCDMTLWRGVCGEDGPDGIELTPGHRELQAFLLARQREGMLLCVCSKNNEADVHAVFERRLDMLLTREALVAEKINWRPKHENLRALAKELRLGLDSFIFIDDDAVECAAIAAALPEVLTVRLPRDHEDLAGFLRHVWAFDRFEVTDEDRQRSVRYRTEVERTRARAAAPSLHDFLAGLDLRVTFFSASDQDLARASQLTFRTNQMNLTTVRRSAAEIAELCTGGRHQCVAVGVRDRFGDYGTVGVMIFTQDDGVLDVDTFLLSCRALGRGVEHRMVAHLGELARRPGQPSSPSTARDAAVVLRYVPTPANTVAGMFLSDIAGAYAAPEPAGTRFTLPAGVAAAVRYLPGRAGSEATSPRNRPAAARGDGTGTPAGNGNRAATADTGATIGRQQHIAEKLRHPQDILHALQAFERRQRSEAGFGEASYRAPISATERRMARIWTEVLSLDQAGREDNFFELGGDSLSLTRIMARFPDAFGVQVSFEEFFDAPTVAELSALIDAHRTEAGNAAREERPNAEQDESANGHDRKTEAAAAPADLRPMAASPADAGPTAAYPAGVGPIAASQPAGSPSSVANRPTGAAPPTRISTLGMITSGRTDLLQRGLSSYIDNHARFGRRCRYLVVDDAPEGGVRAGNRGTLARLATRAGVEIHYAGPEEKKRYATLLARAAGVRNEVVRFALLGAPGFRATAGANRNALLLDTLGEAVFSADDDTVCRIAAPPQVDDDVALASGHDPADFWFFDSHQGAVRAADFVDEDVLAPHEALLGRRVDELVTDTLRDAALSEKHDGDFRRRLRSGTGRVAVTLSGLLGDCGWGAPFGFWIAPMGPLLMEDDSRERLVRSERAYRSACSSREIRRAVTGPRISDHSFSMSTFFALDNRDLMVPVLPVQRGQDLVFGATLWAVARDALFAHVPRTLLHAPAARRPFWPGEVVRTASGIDTARLMLAAVDAWREGHGAHNGGVGRAARLRALGAHLEEIGALPTADFIAWLRAEIGRSNERFLGLLEDALDRWGAAPSYWAQDVQRYRHRLAGAAERPEYVVPLDLQIDRTADEATEAARGLLRSFGELLGAWPDIQTAAHGLRRRGHRLSVKL